MCTALLNAGRDMMGKVGARLERGWDSWLTGEVDWNEFRVVFAVRNEIQYTPCFHDYTRDF